jgi:hypothetical protein
MNFFRLTSFCETMNFLLSWILLYSYLQVRKRNFFFHFYIINIFSIMLGQPVEDSNKDSHYTVCIGFLGQDT